MFLLYAKKVHSEQVFDYIKTVKTEEELDKWIATAVDSFEGVAWMEIQEGQDAEYRTFELDKQSFTVDRRAAYIYEKVGGKINKITDFYIDNVKKIRILSPKYTQK